MSAPMRRAARVDANQAEIVAALRAAGAYVWLIGLPVDALCGYRGKTLLMEFKTRTGKHTDLQSQFFRDWLGGPVATIRDVPGALSALRMLEDKKEETE